MEVISFGQGRHDGREPVGEAGDGLAGEREVLNGDVGTKGNIEVRLDALTSQRAVARL